MSRLEYCMNRVRYKWCLSLSIATPKDKCSRHITLIKLFYYSVSKLLPAFTLMRIRLTLTNSKNSVHHQHALLSPIGKLAIIRDRDTKISIKFFKNILQRRWWINTSFNGKTKTMSLSRTMVRILSNDNSLDVFIRRVLQ